LHQKILPLQLDSSSLQSHLVGSSYQHARVARARALRKRVRTAAATIMMMQLAQPRTWNPVQTMTKISSLRETNRWRYWIVSHLRYRPCRPRSGQLTPLWSTTPRRQQSRSAVRSNRPTRAKSKLTTIEVIIPMRPPRGWDNVPLVDCRELTGEPPEEDTACEKLCVAFLCD
jgi:hypothetical protein